MAADQPQIDIELGGTDASPRECPSTSFHGRDTEVAGMSIAVVNGEPQPTELDRGWKPWSVVAGSFFLTVATFGLLSSIGLFQTYWQENQLAGEDASKISWIISMFGFLDCFVAAPYGTLFDLFGSRILLPVGCAVYLASFLGLAFSRTYGQFMACFVAAGLSSAVPTTISFGVVGHWFAARQGLAMGIVTVGSAAGGIFFSLVLQALFGSCDWRTSILIVFAILCGLVGAGIALVDTRLTKREWTARGCREWLNCLRSTKFWLLCYCVFVYELVLFIQWGSIPSYAVMTGLGNQFNLLMVYNVGAILGRSIPPWVADRVMGPLNTTLLMNGFTLVVAAAVWLPCGDESAAAFYVVTALIGVGTGSFVPLSASCVATLCSPENMGTWLGCCYTVISLAQLVGNPMSQALLNGHGPRALVGFLAAILGSALLVGVVLRWLCLERSWIWRKKI